MFNLEKIQELGPVKFVTKKGQILRKNFQERKQQKKQKFIDGVLEDLEKNHNHSWYAEIYERNKNSLGDIALIYRGNQITYGQMFEKMREYARSLRAMGLQPGQELPICVSNTPEFVYILGAVSMMGAKVNVFSADYAPDYITEILQGCGSNLIFAEDSNYEKLRGPIESAGIKKVIMPSITESLPRINRYEKYDRKHGKFVNLVPKYKEENENVLSIDDFIKQGESYCGPVEEKGSLDKDFCISYSSGTTSDRPKPIVHRTRSFITIGRCHDVDIQKTTSLKKFTILGLIPTFSNSEIIAGVSDTLMQGAKLALEPIYDKDFFLDSLIINQPYYAAATKSFYVNAMKKVMSDPNYKDTKLPNLLLAFAVGEPMERGEEKFLNKGLRKVDAGKKIIPSPVSVVTMSVAGGDCEHGAIFYQLFRTLKSKNPKLRKGESCGLGAFEMVEYAVLDENGNHLGPYQYGRLVANSPCTMKEYKNHPEATDKFFIRDSNGKIWGDCNVYGYLDSMRGIHMKGRIPEKNEELPPFIIADAILKDTKNIMSCEVVKSKDSDYYIAHIELMPGCKKDFFDVITMAELRCKKILGEDITEKVVYRFHDNEKSFQLNHSGKRNTLALSEEGTEFSAKVIVGNNETHILNFEEYDAFRNSNQLHDAKQYYK